LKILFLLVSFFLSLYADIYYAKVEPLSFTYLASDVTGQVLYVNEDALGKRLDGKKFIYIDDMLDKKEYKTLQKKRKLLEETLALTLDVEKNLFEVLQRKKVNYKKVENMSVKSRIEKDREFYTLITSQNSYLNTKKEIDNLRTQLADLAQREAVLQKTIKEKNITAKGMVLYSLEVKKGQVVTKGTPLAKLADTSKALLTLYVSLEDLQNITRKSIYIDDKKTSYKVRRFFNVADSKYLSKYKVEIVLDAPKIFSQLVKVQFKEE